MTRLGNSGLCVCDFKEIVFRVFDRRFQFTYVRVVGSPSPCGCRARVDAEPVWVPRRLQQLYSSNATETTAAEMCQC